jgi:hypothetical protein
VSATDDQKLQRRLRRVEALVASLEACPDRSAREGARELVRTLLDLHAAGLAKMLRLAGEAAPDVVERFAGDGLVGSLLLLHDLHPVSAPERVRRALGRLRGGAGEVEVLEATAEAVRIRLRGDPSAGPALRRAVEEALTEAAPDVPVVTVEELWDRPPPGRIPLPLRG